MGNLDSSFATEPDSSICCQQGINAFAAIGVAIQSSQILPLGLPSAPEKPPSLVRRNSCLASLFVFAKASGQIR
jgi:hypothetical protein